MSASPKSNETSTSSAPGFSEQERAAMKQRATELKAENRGGRGAAKAAADERALLSKIAEMPAADRALAEGVHAIVTAAAPELSPKLWYGQPAYAKNGKVVCFFRSGQMDDTRYSVLGFNEEAKLDDDLGLWPTSYAVTELTDAGAAAIRELVKKAVS